MDQRPQFGGSAFTVRSVGPLERFALAVFALAAALLALVIIIPLAFLALVIVSAIVVWARLTLWWRSVRGEPSEGRRNVRVIRR